MVNGFAGRAWWWQAGFPDVRAQRRAVDWLLDQGLIDQNAAEKFAADTASPVCPDAGTREPLMPLSTKARHFADKDRTFKIVRPNGER
jgi:hypothetical protein